MLHKNIENIFDTRIPIFLYIYSVYLFLGEGGGQLFLEMHEMLECYFIYLQEM